MSKERRGYVFEWEIEYGPPPCSWCRNGDDLGVGKEWVEECSNCGRQGLRKGGVVEAPESLTIREGDPPPSTLPSRHSGSTRADLEP